MSLSASTVNSWTSNPVGGVRFEILLPPLRFVGVDILGASVALSVSCRSVRAVPALARGEGPTPSNSLGGWVEGQILLVEGDRLDNLTLGPVGYGWHIGVSLTFVVRLGEVPTRSLPRGKGVQRYLLQQFTDGKFLL